MEVLVTDGGAGARETQSVCERDEIFCFGEEEKEEWRDSENLEGICVFLF